jgi:hypothetical protein
MAAVAILACSDRSSEAAKSPNAAPREPLVVAPPEEPQGQQIVTSAGGVAAQYTSQFDGQALVSIHEQRESERGSPSHGTYTFQGARLMRYEGAPVGGSGTLSLELDLQGGIISARYGDAQATDEQIIAVRTRAQLLRNHALAQRASHMHAISQP